MWDLIVSVFDHCLSFYFVYRDCVNHQACSLSYNIHVVSGSFIANEYFSYLIRLIMPSNIFSSLIH